MSFRKIAEDRIIHNPVSNFFHVSIEKKALRKKAIISPAFHPESKEMMFIGQVFWLAAFFKLPSHPC